MPYWDDDHMDGGWSVLMVLGMLGLVIVLAALVIWAVTTVRRSPVAAPPPSTGSGTTATGPAEQILATRLALGEIDLEEYRSKLAVITSGPAT